MKTHLFQLYAHTFHDWRMYYDRPSKSWFAYEVDKEGNQIGDAVYAYTRRECEAAMRSEAKARYAKRIKPLADILAAGRRSAIDKGWAVPSA